MSKGTLPRRHEVAFTRRPNFVPKVKYLAEVSI